MYIILIHNTKMLLTFKKKKICKYFRNANILKSLYVESLDRTLKYANVNKTANLI